MAVTAWKTQAIAREKCQLLAVFCSLGLVLTGASENRPLGEEKPTQTAEDKDAATSLDDYAKKRKAIAKAARSHINSEKWSLFIPPPGQYKCNIFVNSVIREAGVRAPVNPKSKLPVMAGRWADTQRKNLWGWVIVEGGSEAAQPGDVVAYRNPNYNSASGHVGIVVLEGPQGLSVSAASGGPVIVDTLGFDGKDHREGREGYVFRRWSRQ